MILPRSAILSSLLGQPGRQPFIASSVFLGSHALNFGIIRSEGRLEDIQGLAALHTPLHSTVGLVD